MRRLITLFVLLILTLLSISACESPTPEPSPTPQPTLTPLPSETPTPPPSATPRIMPQTFSTDPTQQASLRIVHAAPDSEPIDVYVEALNIVASLPFGDSTRPSDLVAGEYRLFVLSAGAAPDETPLVSSSFTINGGDSLILVVTGLADGLTVVPYTENTEPLDVGQSRVRVINAVPRGPDFTLQQGTTPITPVISYGQSSEPVIITSSSTTLAFQQGIRVLLEYPIELRERHSYTLLLIGRADDLASYRVLTFETRVPGSATLRVINAAPTLGSVDVYIGARLVAGAVTFRNISRRETIRAETGNLAIYPAGVNRAETAPITEIQLRPDDRSFTTVILAGSRENLRIFSYEEDLSPVPPEQARLMFAHAHPNAPRLIVENQGGQIEGTGEIAFAQVTDPVLTDATAYTLLWRPALDPANSDTVASIDFTFEAGRSYLYILTDEQNAEPFIVTDEVGIDASLVEVDEQPGEIVTNTPEPLTQLRFINAASNSLSVEFWIGSTAATGGIAYGQGTEMITIAPGFQTISARLAGQENFLATREGQFAVDTRYTILARGERVEDLVLVIIPDTGLIFDGKTYLRLINLSLDTTFATGLAYVESGPQANPSNQSAPRRPGEERLSAPLDSTLLVDDVPALTASTPLEAPPVVVDLYIIDSRSDLSGATIEDYALQTGIIYDVIGFKQVNGDQMLAFILPYPAR